MAPGNLTYWMSLVLFTHLHLGLPSGLFSSGFPTNSLYAFLFSFMLLCLFRNKFIFYAEGLLAPCPTPQAGGLSLVVYPQLLIQYICSYRPYLEAIPPSVTQGRALLW
jgi:hypothetical protein